MSIVVKYKVYRVIPVEKATNIQIGGIIPIPQEEKNFSCSELKKQTEDAFESIRLDVKPDFPSRKSCLFVLPYEKKIVEQWVKAHHSHDDWDYSLLTLELEGELLWCDEDTFTKAGIPIFASKRESLARDYWKSAKGDYSGFCIPEGLFVGRATIVDKEHKYHKGI